MRCLAFNDGWMVRPKTNKFGERPGAGAEWKAVTLPHDTMIGTERSPSAAAATGYFPGGVWEYQKSFDVGAAEAGKAIVLEFEGVYRDAIVQVNGTRAAQWPYGYSSVSVPIDHLLRFGQHNVVRVEARAGEDSRWYTGAGIYRNVWLLEGGRLHLGPDGLDVRTPEIDDSGAVVTIAAAVHNRSTTTSTAAVRSQVLDAAGEVVATDETPLTTFPGDTVTAQQRLFVRDPRRWGPDDPYLYTCRVTVLDGDEVLDEETTTFGIRSLAVDPHRGLRINGEPILLRGACVHHDNGPIGAATIDRAEERRIELLRGAGFNAIRSAHNPMSRAMLDACDRLGMVVMDETFDMWTVPKTDHDFALRFAESWEADVESMVRKDRNHPSVVFYSIGNEIPDGSTPDGLQIGRALAEKVRTLDDTRFVTQAVSGFLAAGPAAFDAIREAAQSTVTDEETGINTTLTNLADLMDHVIQSEVVTEKTTEAFSYLDVAGYNYMDSRFEADGKRFPNRVILSTESYPSWAIDREWQGVTNNEHVIGEFTWTGWDYIGEAGIGRVEHGDEGVAGGMQSFHGDYPWLTAWCGDFDLLGHRRPQSYYREIVFGLRIDPYLAVRPPEHHGRVVSHASPWAFSDVVSSWSWDGHEGTGIVVEVYADADEVELFANGASIGRRPAGEAHRFRAEFDTVYAPGELEAVAWRGGHEVGRTSLRSPMGEVLLDVRADRSEIRADPADLAFVELTLVDEHGSVWTSADRTVTVEVDGPGVLHGLASANPTSEESFVDVRCSTFRGRALAVLRPTGPGSITVAATAEGCPPRQVSISSR